MTNNGRQDEESPSGAEVDPGEPIRELEGLEDDVSPAFIPRIVRSIERRVLSSELVEVVRNGFREMFTQYWTLVVSIFKDRDTTKKNGGGSP